MTVHNNDKQILNVAYSKVYEDITEQVAEKLPKLSGYNFILYSRSHIVSSIRETLEKKGYVVKDNLSKDEIDKARYDIRIARFMINGFYGVTNRVDN